MNELRVGTVSAGEADVIRAVWEEMLRYPEKEEKTGREWTRLIGNGFGSVRIGRALRVLKRAGYVAMKRRPGNRFMWWRMK